jgi:hypothetical protein
VILTEVTPDALPALLGRFAASLRDRRGIAALRRLTRTSPERASGPRAEIHRQRAIRLAQTLGIRVAPGSPARDFGWDGKIMRTGTEAYVLLHEIAHWQLAGPRRRRAFEFGLGPGPETGHRAAALRATLLTGMAREREEAMASLLGILWEVELGQPALASFLDQNWLEGAGRPGTARHFETTLTRLICHGLADCTGRPSRPKPTATARSRQGP